MKMLSVSAYISLLSLFISCSNEGKSSDGNALIQNSTKSELDQFVNSQENPTPDLSSFMDSGVVASTITVEEGATDKLNTIGKKPPQVPAPMASTSNKTLPPVTDPQVSIQSDDVLIAELRSVISNKDRKIQQLILENESLLLRLQEKQSGIHQPIQSETLSNSFSDFRSEIAEVQANLSSQSSDFADLKSQKQILEQRIRSYELTTDMGKFPPRSQKYAEIPSRSPIIENTNINTLTACQLSFDAVVTLQNGKSKEAFYTEFFLLDRNFGQILQDGSIFLSDYSSVSSFEELWAQSRKTPFMFPGLNKKIRSLLQTEVSEGRGYRVRTDLDGAASFENLPARSFNLVGTASLGIVGVTWNLSVRLLSGANKLSLTLANAAWSK
jgi:hypothetical protein